VDLILLDTLDEHIAAFLWLAIEHNASVLVAGGTASGKTTFLNAISLFIRPEKRIVSIEDTAELNLPHENWNPLVERTGFGIRGAESEIKMFELLKAALRQRPDVIIVGEVRGEEAYTMFQAMASVSGDTPILIRDGDGVKLVPIGEFVDRYYGPEEEWVKKYVDGVEALTLDADGKIRFKPVKYVLRHRADKLYRIRYVGGGEIRATGEHSVAVVSDDGDIVTKRVDELKKGDFLVTFVGSDVEEEDIVLDAKEILGGECRLERTMLQRADGGVEEAEVVVPKSGRGKHLPRYIKLDGDLAFTLGVYLADGCVKEHRGKRICISLGSDEKVVISRINKVFERFGVKPSVDDRGSYVILEYGHTLLASLFEKIIGGKLEEKHIPSFMWRAKKDIVKEFLNGYKCDARRSTNKQYTSYSSKSRDLALEILWLSRLKGYGGFVTKEKDCYSANIYLDKLSKKMTQAHRIPIQPIRKLYELLKPRNMPWKYTYVLRSGRKTITKKKALELLNYIVENRRRELDKNARRIIENIRLLISSNIGVAEVLDVKEEATDEYVYDVSIPGTELFIGGTVPIVLHNTGHGGLGSIHAESVRAVINRLTSEPMNVPKPLISTLNLIVLITRMRLGEKIVRKVVHVAEPYYDEETGDIRINDVFVYDAYSRTYRYSGRSRTLERISMLTGIPVERLEEEIRRRKLIIEWMVKKGIRRFREVAEIIRRFYMNPEEVYQLAQLELLKMGG